MEMGTIRTKVSRSHSEIIAFLSLTFCNPNPTYDMHILSEMTLLIKVKVIFKATGQI